MQAAALQSASSDFRTDKTKLMQAAIRSSLNDGLFIDTKFYAFSRRRRTGVVDKPRPLFVNSKLIRDGSKDFGSLLNNDFKEGKLVQTLRDPFPTDRPSFTEDYYNDSDSDLENEPDTEKHSVPQAGGSTLAEKPKPAKDTSESESKISNSNPHTQLPALDKTECDKFGRVIVVPDVAFTTLRAFMLWICTGDLAFSHLKSQMTRLGASDVTACETFRCSPKSMYRLADKWGVQELQKQALQDIRSKLSKENIMHELCSFVTSTYTEIRDMEITFVLESPQCRDAVLEALPRWLADVTSGKSARTTDTLAAFVQGCVGMPKVTAKNNGSSTSGIQHTLERDAEEPPRPAVGPYYRPADEFLYHGDDDDDDDDDYDD